MADPVEYTPVSTLRGRVVHATSLSAPTRTACGRSFNGWRVSTERLNCRSCKLAIAQDCRPTKKSKSKILKKRRRR